VAKYASFSARVSERSGVRYAVALLATLVALLARLVLNPILGDSIPYVALVPAVAFFRLVLRHWPFHFERDAGSGRGALLVPRAGTFAWHR